MVDLTSEQIAQRAFDLDLLDERQLKSVWAQCGTRDVPVHEFRNLLVRRELMTNYQVEKLLRGEKTGFFYGDYKVLYLVGTGSFARVYRAVHREDGRVVAVKVLRNRFVSDSKVTEQFLREGRMGASLRHANIVPIYEVHSVRRVYFLVMAFVEGQSLRDFVKIRKKLEPLEATELMAGVVSGLVYAAEKGITHRDLKLSNVLISSDGRPQLVDFGLAAAEGSDDVNPRTIDYAALERATGVRKDDPRSDIFFAGCMYYHLLCGQPPLPETRDRVQRMSTTRFKEVTRIRELLPEIPPQVEATVEKSMHIDADQRYSKPVEFLVDLRKTAKQLNEADTTAPTDAPSDERSEGATVMLVESSKSVQDALRKGLRQSGFRVLVIGDPQRAFRRMLDNASEADCVVISTSGLGKQGTELFQSLASAKTTSQVPLLLLLGKRQSELATDLDLSGARVAVSMPIRLSQLRSAVEKLLAARSGA